MSKPLDRGDVGIHPFVVKEPLGLPSEYVARFQLTEAMIVRQAKTDRQDRIVEQGRIVRRLVRGLITKGKMHVLHEEYRVRAASCLSDSGANRSLTPRGIVREEPVDGEIVLLSGEWDVCRKMLEIASGWVSRHRRRIIMAPIEIMAVLSKVMEGRSGTVNLILAVLGLDLRSKDDECGDSRGGLATR